MKALIPRWSNLRALSSAFVRFPLPREAATSKGRVMGLKSRGGGAISLPLEMPPRFLFPNKVRGLPARALAPFYHTRGILMIPPKPRRLNLEDLVSSYAIPFGSLSFIHRRLQLTTYYYYRYPRDKGRIGRDLRFDFAEL